VHFAPKLVRFALKLGAVALRRLRNSRLARPWRPKRDRFISLSLRISKTR
jgi:hypothetical protein